MAGGEVTPLRNIPVPKVIQVQRPSVYPIFLVYLPGETE